MHSRFRREFRLQLDSQISLDVYDGFCDRKCMKKWFTIEFLDGIFRYDLEIASKVQDCPSYFEGFVNLLHFLKWQKDGVQEQSRVLPKHNFAKKSR